MRLDDGEAASSSAAGASAEPEASGDAAPATAAEDGAADGDADLDFGEMKKKKKKSKKAAFDMEAFEKELGEEGPAGAGGEDETAQGDLGEDVFANDEDGEGGAGAGGEVETWHGTDRDYTYQEVSWRCGGEEDRCWGVAQRYCCCCYPRRRHLCYDMKADIPITSSRARPAPRPLLRRAPSPQPCPLR